MTLMFLSRGYFASWNCLREVRHAMLVHLGGQDGFAHTALTQAADDRRRELGNSVSSSIVLVRETDEVMHGGQPIDDLLQACPEHIGCADHVFSYDGGCEACSGFGVGVRATLAQHVASSGPGLGVVEWRRAQAFKLVSLKQIVQAMLLASTITGNNAGSTQQQSNKIQRELELSSCAVYVSGEIDSLAYAIAKKTAPCVLLHSGCHLTEELQSLLKTAVSGLDMRVVDGDSSHGDETSIVDGECDIAGILSGGGDPEHPVILVVVVHRGCFKNIRVVRSLLLALETKTQIVLVHESDETNRGCDFGEVIATCPVPVKNIRGFNGQKVFEPIAVQWTRGAHQPVSVRILALALGAQAASSADHSTCFTARRAILQAAKGLFAQHIIPKLKKSTKKPEGDELGGFSDLGTRERGWSAFGGSGDAGNPNALTHVLGGEMSSPVLNPMVMNLMAGGGGKEKGGSSAPAQNDRSI
jgi:hypothetical protein